MADDDPSIRFLLAGGRLSGADHDRILERVRRGEIPAARFRGWLFGIGTAVSAVAAALALVVGLPRRAGEEDGLTAKGAAPAGPVLVARCFDRAPGSCRVGDRLIFEVSGASGGGLLVAYAEAPSGERIWYFPTKDGHFASVPASSGRSVLGEAARIGPEHPPGRYTLHLALVGAPVERSALVGGGIKPRGEALLPLEVEP